MALACAFQRVSCCVGRFIRALSLIARAEAAATRRLAPQLRLAPTLAIGR